MIAGTVIQNTGQLRYFSPPGEHPRVRRLGTGFLARTVLISISVGMVLLVLLDWLYDFDIIETPFAKYVRAFLLVIFSLYLLRTSLRFSSYDFRFGRLLFFFLALNVFYTLTSAQIMDNLYSTMRIAFWILGTVIAYRLARSGALSDSVLHKVTIATILLASAFTIYFMTRPETEAGRNASAYLLLWCLPLLLMVKKSRFNTVALGLAVFAILLTVKRGAMIALGLSIIAYGLCYLKLYASARAFAKALGAFALLVAVVAFALSYNLEAVQTRFQDTSGSGRDQVYAMLFDHWIAADPAVIISGFGINSVQQYTGVMLDIVDGLGPYAHSDWLQLMHDFGLLGIGFLVWLHLTLIRLILSCYRSRHPFTPSLVMGYTILFLVNIYSGHLIGPTAIYFGLLLAYGSIPLVSLRSTPPNLAINPT